MGDDGQLDLIKLASLPTKFDNDVNDRIPTDIDPPMKWIMLPAFAFLNRVPGYIARSLASALVRQID
jgi:hypothetical protein